MAHGVIINRAIMAVIGLAGDSKERLSRVWGELGDILYIYSLEANYSYYQEYHHDCSIENYKNKAPL